MEELKEVATVTDIKLLQKEVKRLTKMCSELKTRLDALEPIPAKATKYVPPLEMAAADNASEIHNLRLLIKNKDVDQAYVVKANPNGIFIPLLFPSDI